EDGIRDDLVTGVQTCALPISAGRRAAGAAAAAGPARSGGDAGAGRAACPRAGAGPSEGGRSRPARDLGEPRRSRPTAAPLAGIRSEERRVGKERRSGGEEETG